MKISCVVSRLFLVAAVCVGGAAAAWERGDALVLSCGGRAAGVLRTAKGGWHEFR